jgi:3-phenylpropionate/trans-cinnamate dioxygenase ferredoxin subunit
MWPANNTNITWHPTIHQSTLTENKITELIVAEKTICLLKREDKVYAFAPTCPHSGGKLCEGWLDPQGRVVCPLHKYRFNPVNGHNTSGEGYKLKTYPTDLRENIIFVQF